MNDERSRGHASANGRPIAPEESTRLLLLVTIGTVSLTLLTAQPDATPAAEGFELRLWPPVLLVLALVVAAWGVRGARALLRRAGAARIGRSRRPRTAPPTGPAVAASTHPASGPTTDPAPDVLVSRVGDVSRLIRVEDIDWIEASGRYTAVHAGGRRHLLNRSLASLEEALDGRFVRVHRSTLVSLDRVAAVRRLDGRDFEIGLRDGTTLRLSRTYRETLERELGIRL